MDDRTTGTGISLTLRTRCRWVKRQSDPDGRALADLTLDRHPAAVSLNDTPADRQPQAGAALFRCAGRINAIEPLTEVRQMLRSKMRFAEQYKDHRIGMMLADFRNLGRRVTIAGSDLPQTFTRHAVQSIDGVAVVAGRNQ